MQASDKEFDSLFSEDMKENVVEYKELVVPQVATSEFSPLMSLPSKGRFYSSQVYAQSPKVDDCLLIATVNNVNVHDKYEALFSKRVRGVEYNDILSADFIYILLWLRETAYPGYPYHTEEYKCGSCGYVQHGKAQMSDIIIDVPDKDISSFKKRVDIGEHSFTISLSTKFSDKIYNKFCEAIPVTYDDTEKELLKRYAKVAIRVEIEGTRTINERIDYIRENVSPGHFIQLVSAVREHDLTADIRVNCKCERCGTPNSPKFFFRTTYFLPTV